MKGTIILLAWIFSISSCTQEKSYAALIGDWETEEIIDNRLKIDIDFFDLGTKKETKGKVIYSFKENQKVIICTKDSDIYKYDFEVKDSTLFFGNVSYQIEVLDSIQLILSRKKGLHNEKLIFSPSKITINDFNNIETVEEFHSSGNKKLKGRKRNGIRDGIWIEWFEGTKIKEVTNYQYGVIISKVTFTKEGGVLEKYYYDINSKKSYENNKNYCQQRL